MLWRGTQVHDVVIAMTSVDGQTDSSHSSSSDRYIYNIFYRCWVW